MRVQEYIIFLLVALSGAYFIQGGSWNQNARFDLTRAIVERQSLDCAPFADNSGDMVERNGMIIPYKAPGASFLAVPVWAALYLGGLRHVTHNPFAMNFGLHIITVSIGVIALAWAAMWFFRFCIALRPGAARQASWTTLAAFCGTILFPLGTIMLGHATVSAFIWVAFVRALAVVPGTEKNGLAIGFLLGWAVAVDYLVLPAAAAIFVLAAMHGEKGRWRGILIGAMPAAIILGAYHWAVLGAPWRIPYSNPPIDYATPGAVGGLFLTPSFNAVWNTTFGPYRGLFFGSPILLAGLWGLKIVLKKESPWRKAALVSTFIIAVHFLFLWTFNGWHGGWTFGARYFSAAILFMAWPLILVIDRAKRGVQVAAVISVLMMFMVTSVNPQPPAGIPELAEPNPWFDYYIPAFAAGDLADHVQSALEMYPRYETWPRGRDLWEKIVESSGDALWKIQQRIHWQKVAREHPSEIYNPRSPDVAGATNLGLLAGLPGLFSLIPLALIWGVLGYLLWKENRLTLGCVQ